VAQGVLTTLGDFLGEFAAVAAWFAVYGNGATAAGRFPRLSRARLCENSSTPSTEPIFIGCNFGRLFALVSGLINAATGGPATEDVNSPGVREGATLKARASLLARKEIGPPAKMATRSVRTQPALELLSVQSAVGRRRCCHAEVGGRKSA